MRKLVSVILLLMAVLTALSQSPAPKWEPATIMAVTSHTGPPEGDPARTRFDISIRAGNTVYVVLYTTPPGAHGAEYTQGMGLLVLVGEKTITFNDVLGISREVPILSRTAVPSRSSH